MPASLSPGASIQVDLGLPLLQAQGGRGRGGREGRDERRTEATGTQYRRNRHFHDYTTTSAACMPCQLNCLHSKCTTLRADTLDHKPIHYIWTGLCKLSLQDHNKVHLWNVSQQTGLKSHCMWGGGTTLLLHCTWGEGQL